MFIPINPVAKPRLTQRDRWAQRPAVVRYHAFCDELRNKFKYNLPPVLVLEFFMPMPKTWALKKKGRMAGQPHQQRPDIDNLCKAVMDALSDDDSYIYVLHAKKYWSYEPGIEIILSV